MEETTIYAELRGGVLDGLRRVVNKKNPPDKLVLKNPNPLTYQSKLCAPLVLRHVVYSLCWYSESQIYYGFYGHIE